MAPTRTGYQFGGWQSDNPAYADLAADATETPEAVDGQNVNYTAKWVQDITSHTVTFDAGANGNFANASDLLITQTVQAGDHVAGVPAISANSRYRFDGWRIGGTGRLYSNAEVQEMLITANITFVASYTRRSSSDDPSINTVYIYASAGEGGKISPDGTVVVSKRTNKTFKITANSGYEIADVLVDGESVGAVKEYEFKNVMDSHKISVTFKKTEKEPDDEPQDEPKNEVADPKDTGVADILETEAHGAYLAGYETGDFGPNRNMTRAEAAQMFYNLLKVKTVPVTVQFTDVPENAWYAKAVHTLASLDVIKGVGANKYDPNRAITRAEFAAIATRFAKADNEGTVSLRDVSETEWYYNAVLTAVNYGWINGYEDNTFKPHNTITRAEVTTIVNKMLDRAADKDFVSANETDLKKFHDVADAFWAYHQILEATNGHDHEKTNGAEMWKKLH